MQNNNLQIQNFRDSIRQIKADHDLIIDLMLQVDSLTAEIKELKERLNNIKENENGHSQTK